MVTSSGMDLLAVTRLKRIIYSWLCLQRFQKRVTASIERYYQERSREGRRRWRRVIQRQFHMHRRQSDNSDGTRSRIVEQCKRRQSV